MTTATVSPRSQTQNQKAETVAEGDNLRYTKLPLNGGSGEIPALGFGTLIPDPIATKAATKLALEAGFRALDTAERYRTEKQVGEAMQEVFKAGTVKREDVFVITKLWNTNHRPERVKPAFEASLDKLQLDYVDLYLIHTPFAFQPGDDQDPRDASGNMIYDKTVTLLDTWHALEALVDEGRCKAIGLSDVDLARTQEIVAAARIKPAVVHVESHPYLPQWELLEYCKSNGIVMQAFAALGHGMEPSLLKDPVVTAIATRVKKTPAQVLLAWAIQRGTAPSDHRDKSQPDRRKFRRLRPSRRGRAGDQRRSQDAGQIQCRRGNGRSRVHSESEVRFPITRNGVLGISRCSARTLGTNPTGRASPRGRARATASWRTLDSASCETDSLRWWAPA